MVKKILDALTLSKPNHLSESDQQKGIEAPPLFKAFDGERVALPPVEKITWPDVSLKSVIESRRSHRKYVAKPLSLKALSFALYVTQGLRHVVKDKATFRNVPSAGARHPFETYLLINHVDTLDAGLYAYDPQQHALVFLAAYDTVKDNILKGCLNQKMVLDASVSFFWVADIYRMAYRYVERSLRYLHLDAGHIGQNLYLAAEAINAKTCAIGAFDDDQLNDALSLNTENETVIYAAPLGFKSFDDAERL